MPQVVGVPLRCDTISQFLATRAQLLKDADVFKLKLNEYVQSLITSAIVQYRRATPTAPRDRRLLRVFAELSELSRKLSAHVPCPIVSTRWLEDAKLRDRRPAPEQVLQQLAEERKLNLATKFGVTLMIAEDELAQSLCRYVGGRKDERISLWLTNQTLKTNRKAKSKKASSTALTQYISFGFDPLAPKWFPSTTTTATTTTTTTTPTISSDNGKRTFADALKDPKGKGKRKHPGDPLPPPRGHGRGRGSGRGRGRGDRGGGSSSSSGDSAMMEVEEVAYGTKPDWLLDREAKRAEERRVAEVQWESAPAEEYDTLNGVLTLREKATHMRACLSIEKFLNNVLQRTKSASRLVSFLDTIPQPPAKAVETISSIAYEDWERQVNRALQIENNNMEAVNNVAMSNKNSQGEERRRLLAAFGMGSLLCKLFPARFANEGCQNSAVVSTLLCYSEEMVFYIGHSLMQYAFHIALTNPRIDPVMAAYLARLPMPAIPSAAQSDNYNEVAAKLFAQLETYRTNNQRNYRALSDHPLPTERPPNQPYQKKPKPTPTPTPTPPPGRNRGRARARARGRGRGGGRADAPPPSNNTAASNTPTVPVPPTATTPVVVGANSEWNAPVWPRTNLKTDDVKEVVLMSLVDSADAKREVALAKERKLQRVRNMMLYSRDRVWQELPNLTDVTHPLGQQLTQAVATQPHFTEKRVLTRDLAQSVAQLGRAQKQLRFWDSRLKSAYHPPGFKPKTSEANRRAFLAALSTGQLPKFEIGEWIIFGTRNEAATPNVVQRFPPTTDSAVVKAACTPTDYCVCFTLDMIGSASGSNKNENYGKVLRGAHRHQRQMKRMNDASAALPQTIRQLKESVQTNDAKDVKNSIADLEARLTKLMHPSAVATEAAARARVTQIQSEIDHLMNPSTTTTTTTNSSSTATANKHGGQFVEEHCSWCNTAVQIRQKKKRTKKLPNSTKKRTTNTNAAIKRAAALASATKPLKNETKTMDVERVLVHAKNGRAGLFAVPNSGGAKLCPTCLQEAAKQQQLAVQTMKKTVDELVVPAKVHAGDVLVWSVSEVAKQLTRPWMQPEKMRSPRGSVDFNHLEVWTRSNYFTSDGKGAERLLREYHETLDGKQLELSGSGEYLIAARDRVECGHCQGCKTPDPKTGEIICQTCWYPAYLEIRNTSYNGLPEKVAVVTFPGYAPSRENQQNEFYLLRRLIANDPILLRDVNIRVFCWNDINKLAGQIARIRPQVNNTTSLVS